MALPLRLLNPAEQMKKLVILLLPIVLMTSIANAQEVDWSFLHTPEEMRNLSNLGHLIEGALLLLVAFFAILEAFGFKKIKFIWPSLLLIVGTFLISFLLFQHGLDKVKLIGTLLWKDAQQREHLIMSILFIAAGLSQILSVNYKISYLSYVWPLSLLIIGTMLLIHEQHGSAQAVQRAETIHTYVGILLILDAIFVILSIKFSIRYTWLPYVWPALLLVISILLMIYREPEGAYQTDRADRQQLNYAHPSGT